MVDGLELRDDHGLGDFGFGVGLRVFGPGAGDAVLVARAALAGRSDGATVRPCDAGRSGLGETMGDKNEYGPLSETVSATAGIGG